ncbi:zinc-dependent alcohol dehydrogenase [Streptomyces iranensis]|uniref:zinc-dependent alcohol dehydrogenase n=1 Tax=Streptomyces iranensis TaxID=576784 RepID=UPI0039B751CA
MQALVKRSGTPGDVAVMEREVPDPPSGHLLIRTEACGLCGSDVHAWRGDRGYEWVAPPVTFGHEAVGRVIAVGPGADPARVGNRVVPIAIDGCGECVTCRRGLRQICPRRTVLGLSFDGAAAESFLISEARVVEVDVDLTSKLLALTEPVSVAYRAVRHLEQSPGGPLDVVVSGPGPIGLAAALLLSQRGHHVVLTGAERDRDLRLATAASLGLKALVATEAEELTPDGWIEASGSAHGLGAALRQTMPGGTVVVPGLFGAPADPDVNLLTRREICLKGSYGSQAEDYRHAMSVLAADPQLWSSLLDVRPLADGVAGLQAAASGETFKVVLVPGAN